MKRFSGTLMVVMLLIAVLACGQGSLTPAPATPAATVPPASTTSAPPTTGPTTAPTAIPPTSLPAIGSITKLLGAVGAVQAGPESALVNVDPQRDMNTNDGVHVSNGGKAKLDFGYGLAFTLYNDSTTQGTNVDKSGTSAQVIAKLSQGGLKGSNPPGSRTEVDLPDGGKIFILGTDYFIAYDPVHEIAWAYNFDGTMQFLFSGGTLTDLPAHALLTYVSGTAPKILLNQTFSPDDFDKYATQDNSPIQGVSDLLHNSSKIYEKYVALGGPNGFLGNPVAPEASTSDGRGSFEDFQGGSIYWSPETGAYEIQGAILDKWMQLGGFTGFLGYPITDAVTLRGGLYNEFQNGSIYWTPKTGTFEVHGLIRDKWISLGAEKGALGYPVTDETGTPDGVGRYNHFQNGSIYWTQQTGAFEVLGPIRDKWANLGWEQSVLGYPVTDQTTTPDGVGRYNHFQYGSIYWTPDTGAFEVHGAIRDKWSSLGWENSPLGYPISDETGASDGVGRYNRFQYGAIYWTPNTGAWAVYGAIYGKWSDMGAEKSLLGYPVTDETGTPDGVGRFNHFQYGSIYWTPNTGAWEVHGAIRDKWSSLGWETSCLGYPITDVERLSGIESEFWTFISKFQHGYIQANDQGATTWDCPTLIK